MITYDNYKAMINSGDIMDKRKAQVYKECLDKAYDNVQEHPQNYPALAALSEEDFAQRFSVSNMNINLITLAQDLKDDEFVNNYINGSETTSPSIVSMTCDKMERDLSSKDFRDRVADLGDSAPKVDHKPKITAIEYRDI